MSLSIWANRRRSVWQVLQWLMRIEIAISCPDSIIPLLHHDQNSVKLRSPHLHFITKVQLAYLGIGVKNQIGWYFLNVIEMPRQISKQIIHVCVLHQFVMYCMLTSLQQDQRQDQWHVDHENISLYQIFDSIEMVIKNKVVRKEIQSDTPRI
jgi:hypothetical protein